MAERSEKCPVKGCPGRVEYDSNGQGSVTGRCACCDRRALWELQHIPRVRRLTCAICLGGFVVPKTGGQPRKYCPPCNRIALHAQQVTWKENRKRQQEAAP